MKIFRFTLILFFFLVFLGAGTYALNPKVSGKILEKFKEEQYDILFESDTLIIDEDDTKVLNIAKKIALYDSISDSLKLKRERLEETTQSIALKVFNLEDAIAQLDSDMEEITESIDAANSSVIAVKKKVNATNKKISLLQKKISEHKKILLEYIVYIYKKGNISQTEESFDNLKAILLSGDDVGAILNDLHFNSIIQVAGKKLIDKHKAFVNELYAETKELEEQNRELKMLRKSLVLNRKILSDKIEFKERLLKVTQGKQSLYEKFIEDKVQSEKNIALRKVQEKIRFNASKNELLKKYGCDFIDISGGQQIDVTADADCVRLNKTIYAESRLTPFVTEGNILEWPLIPIHGLSAYFNDEEYRHEIGSDHDAIDIRTPQGTNVAAAADGYVIHRELPVVNGYSYVAVKHADGYVTVYGHLSEVLVDDFDIVRAGQIIGKSGGEYGTPGAGVLTTGPHLHFEVFKDKELTDPLQYLNISYLSFDDMPGRYEVKYYVDFKQRKGYEYAAKANKKVFRLEGNNEAERQKDLLTKYAAPVFRDWDMWVEESLEGGLDPTFVMCIGLAESGLGRNLKTPYNVGNIGNTDSGATQTFPNARSGVYWMIQTLNNRYLGGYDEIRLLSRYGNKDKNKPIYASSPNNWHNNIIKCMSHIKGRYVPDDYNFRIKKADFGF